MVALAGLVGALIVVLTLADMVNTLVTTAMSQRWFWLTTQFYKRSWQLVRFVARHVRSPARRERLLATYAPVSVLALLVLWVVLQILGFGLLWWSLEGYARELALWDAVYLSGVFYFSLGLADVADTVVPQVGAVIEAFVGVLTTALVIGYLPSLYSAYAERERPLPTLDDGSDGAITPTSLVCSRAPDGDVGQLASFFQRWEDWAAETLETHSTFPMLTLFRSKHADQHWVTALGLVADAAVLVETTRGDAAASAHWTLRRAAALIEELLGTDELTERRRDHGDGDDEEATFRAQYDELGAHGLELMDYEEARALHAERRSRYQAGLEVLREQLVAPRSFCAHGASGSPRRAADALIG